MRLITFYFDLLTPKITLLKDAFKYLYNQYNDMSDNNYDDIRRAMYERGIPREEQDLMITLAKQAGRMNVLEDKYGDSEDV